MFGTKLNYDTLLFLDGQEVSGINSVDISYSNSTNVVNPLGYKEGLTTVVGNVDQTFSFTRDLISNSILGSGIGGRQLTLVILIYRAVFTTRVTHMASKVDI